VELVKPYVQKNEKDLCRFAELESLIAKTKSEISDLEKTIKAKKPSAAEKDKALEKKGNLEKELLKLDEELEIAKKILSEGESQNKYIFKFLVMVGKFQDAKDDLVKKLSKKG
jgi:hypothetical protein